MGERGEGKVSINIGAVRADRVAFAQKATIGRDGRVVLEGVTAMENVRPAEEAPKTPAPVEDASIPTTPQQESKRLLPPPEDFSDDEPPIDLDAILGTEDQMLEKLYAGKPEALVFGHKDHRPVETRIIGGVPYILSHYDDGLLRWVYKRSQESPTEE